MRQLLALALLSPPETGALVRLTRTILDCGCRISQSSFTTLGNEGALVLLLNGSWDSVARLESNLERLRDKQGLALVYKRTTEAEAHTDLLPYEIDLVALEHEGIVHEVAAFLDERAIHVVDLSASAYPAAHTGAPMFSLRMTIGIPSGTHIASLREEFIGFCDDLNLDAILEPLKE
jgi:glycine cleavage system transcriptional repressor